MPRNVPVIVLPRIAPVVVLLAAATSCMRDIAPIDESDRLALEGSFRWLVAVSFNDPPPPPRPPPPPPPPPEPLLDRAPPAEILDFLRAHAHDADPWRVTIYELPSELERGPRFMGRHVRRHRVLGRGAAVQLVSKLAQSIYEDGVCGCAVDISLGIRIARGGAHLDLVYTWGHLYLTTDGHSGRFVVFPEPVFIYDLAASAGL